LKIEKEAKAMPVYGGEAQALAAWARLFRRDFPFPAGVPVFIDQGVAL